MSPANTLPDVSTVIPSLVPSPLKKFVDAAAFKLILYLCASKVLTSLLLETTDKSIPPALFVILIVPSELAIVPVVG